MYYETEIVLYVGVFRDILIGITRRSTVRSLYVCLVVLFPIVHTATHHSQSVTAGHRSILEALATAHCVSN